MNRNYYNIEDLPGDPTASEFALLRVKSEHVVCPFDDVAVFGNEAMLLVCGDLGGSMNLEMLMLLGAQA